MKPVSMTPVTCSDFVSMRVTLPTSLCVIQISLLSGVICRNGENGLTTSIFLTILCDLTSITSTEGVKLDTTKASLPSGWKITIPGPRLVWMRSVSLKVWGSMTEM
ncbi:Uncharacterised protein [Bordetella parapertussis]|nr:Uncharacterised protein [Bordetella parapertussis]SUV53856.1 Uncharacterised protein [Bordetella parapertussis]SUV73954.1 Uncharacterised protein [Bordetella parapertussis]VEF50704.1 Uncharacterised protein [Bordetella parapertussis]VTR25164.1 Uncharacterised protein [Bordetella parapertussis]